MYLLAKMQSVVADTNFWFLSSGAGSRFDTVDHADEFHIFGSILRNFTILEGIKTGGIVPCSTAPFRCPACIYHTVVRRSFSLPKWVDFGNLVYAESKRSDRIHLACTCANTLTNMSNEAGQVLYEIHGVHDC